MQEGVIYYSVISKKVLKKPTQIRVKGIHISKPQKRVPEPIFKDTKQGLRIMKMCYK